MRSFADGLDEYHALDLRIKMAMNFGEFFHLKGKHRLRVGTS